MIARLDLPAEEKTRLLNNIPVAYAVSYLVGTGFVVWFLSSLAPRLLKRGPARPRAASSRRRAGRRRRRARRELRLPRVGRARLPGPRTAFAGRTVGERRAVLRARPRVRRADPAGRPARHARPGHRLPAGRRRGHRAPPTCSLAAERAFGAEVEDRDLLDFPMAVLDVVVTRQAVAERSARRARRASTAAASSC